MCALTPMFPSKQQEWYSASTMEYPWLQSQADSFSPTLQYLPSFLYPLDDSKSHNINHHMSLSHSNDTNSNSNINGQEEVRGTVLEKKLNHNASERDRRRKLNALYSSLRALLPLSEQKRKLSIPMTVARVVKYIPEQKQELQRLSRRKEELLKRISRKTHQQQLRNKAMMDSIDSSSSQRIAANWLTDTEIAVQIATSKWTSISDMLLRLEENGLNVISVSSSVSSTAMIFYALHLQMTGDCKVRLEELINGMLLGLRQS
ncbi:Helix-loop-helix DNA-binding domain superfamily [Arabidopsis thaliana x Arabidopsis arenosa]|uniref:Helix-loop-helix DNA-binding domain superfamily n=1 Tax=Arabidopsis thaliana x Arabidopsis arenosa TaxID=1240361 RepID=A0A8T1YT32_9BRAS|nr:Helix-loop-helix DNA-binding domain superfamily [Arabidopsis thaliana x Arabidopsis arenosa]